MRSRSIAAVVLALGALTACGGGGGFERSDPEAHHACTKYLEDPVLKDNPDEDELTLVLGTALIVGEHASKATTPEIRATANELEGLSQWLVDGEALIAVCSANGYEVNEGSIAEHRQEQGN